ncbi:hypothetical protein M8J75_014248 [Diaphorina citri]|nr:hypothetical protein M8J75_014248 [Diaphorina citri]
MSNDLPPFVSNSPPPLCHSESVESDDDFGDFSTAYEAYDSPKKKAPDLYNGIIEHISNEFTPPPTSQSTMCNDVTMNKHNPNNEMQIVHPVHTEPEQIPNFTKTNIFLDESIPSKVLSSSTNHVDHCTKPSGNLDERSISNSANGEITTLSEDCTINMNEHSNQSNDIKVEMNEPCTYGIVPCKNNLEDNDNTSLEEEEQSNSVSSLHIETTCDTPAICDVPNSNLTPIKQTDIHFPTDQVCDFNPNFEQFIKEDNTIDDVTDNNSMLKTDSSTDMCDTQQKRKRGISSEIKKFLENEKNIENEFTNFESKFRSFEVPSVGFEAELSPDTPPTSPEFGPKIELSKSFDDDLDDEFGSFENFNNLKSNENTEDFGDFKCSEVSEQNVSNELDKNTEKPNDTLSAVVKGEACSLQEDGISTKDIELEFSEQNICDSNEIVITQDSVINSANKEILPPPLDVDEIHFENKEDSFETDFGHFESATNVPFEHVTVPSASFIKELDTNDTSISAEGIANAVENQSIKNAPDISENIDVDDEDEFGDFSSVVEFSNQPVPNPSSLPVPHIIPSKSTSDRQTVSELPPTKTNLDDEDDDDFGDFSSENFVTQAPTPKLFDVSTLDMENLFEKPTGQLPEVAISTLDHILSQDEAWRRLHDIENTPALSYQWSNSESNKALLTSLNIDTRNIIFGPRWKENVPRFAANLGYSPLEPSKPGALKCDPHTGELSSPLQDHIPDAHFDWNGSGLTNPLEGCPSYLLHLDVVSLFDNLSTPDHSTLAGPSKSSRQTLEEELSGPTFTSPLPPEVVQPRTTIPAKPTASSQELIINVEKFVDSLPNVGFMLASHVVYPSK